MFEMAPKRVAKVFKIVSANGYSILKIKDLQIWQKSLKYTEPKIIKIFKNYPPFVDEFLRFEHYFNTINLMFIATVSD